MVHSMRAEVVQRNDAGDDWSKRGGDSRIAHVAYMALAFDGEVVNFGLECFAPLRGGAGKNNQHTAAINYVYFESLRTEPLGYCSALLICSALALAHFP